MSSQSSSGDDYTITKVLNWTRGLETFERLDLVYLLVHSLFPTELRYMHGIIDGLVKRDEALFASSVHQANDFVRLSNFYEGHDPHAVIASDGLRRQFIVDLSALHPLNFYCAEIFFNVLAGAEVSTWEFNSANIKILRELILITTMVGRHPAFRFDCRLCIWNSSRKLRKKLKDLEMFIQEVEEEESRRMRDNVDSPETDIHVVEPRSLESEATLTASGSMVRGERNLNGFIEPILLPAAPVSFTHPPQHPAPVLAPVRIPTKVTSHQNSSVPMRPKTVSDTRAPEGRKQMDPNFQQTGSAQPRRASSVEHCDYTPSRSSTKDKPVAEPDQVKGKRNFNTQYSDPSTPNSIRPQSRGEAASRQPEPQSPANSEPSHPDTNSSGYGSGFSPGVILSQETPNALRSPQVAARGRGNNITGAFPHSYKYAPNGVLSNPAVFGPHPDLQNHQKNISCCNCGQKDHLRVNCPNKKPLSTQDTENYCTLKRDAKQYPQKGRPPPGRPPGSN